MRSLEGRAAAPGVVRGPWIRIDPAPPPTGGRIDPGSAADEIERLREASSAVADDLEAIAGRVDADGHPDEAAIFQAQASISRDPALATMAAERITESGEDAIAAVQAAAGSFADQLRSLDDEVLAARSADVVDVGQRIARRLSGVTDTAGDVLTRAAVVVADDLPPSVTATLPREHILGIALDGSSPTAHAAILARAYGIPAVVGAGELLETLRVEAEGGRAVELAIDGSSGEIVIDPDEATRARFDARTAAARRRGETDRREATQPAVTLDGTEITLLANIGTPDESDEAVALGAHGVGLFRTEFLFLERTSPPSETEQVAAYEHVVRAFAPHQVTIRLLDVGGDKPIPYLPVGHEANPFLGRIITGRISSGTVRTSLLASVVGVHAFQGTRWTVAGEVGRAQGNHHPSIAPYGLFHCAGCDLPVYSSAAKFDSGTGWPSFTRPLANAVRTKPDRTLFIVRTEVHCRRCGGHLGHVFDDGPPPTGQRWCMNGLALKFRPA